MAKITGVGTKVDVVVKNVPLANKIVANDINQIVSVIDANDDEHLTEVANREAADIALNNAIVALQGSLRLQASWNADTNTPDISATTETGYYWIVSVDGATDIGGITDWKVNDWAIKTDIGWAKVDNSDKVISVAGRIGEVVLGVSDITSLQSALNLRAPINGDSDYRFSVADATTSKNAINKSQFDAAITAQQTDISTKANLAGGNTFTGIQQIDDEMYVSGVSEFYEDVLIQANLTMEGDIEMGGLKVKSLGQGTESNDAVNFEQLETKANLSGGNDFTGNQNVNGDVNISLNGKLGMQFQSGINPPSAYRTIEPTALGFKANGTFEFAEDVTFNSDLEVEGDATFEGNLEAIENITTPKINEEIHVKQSNLSLGESVLAKFNNRITADSGVYYQNSAGYEYAKMKEQGLLDNLSIWISPTATKLNKIYGIKGADLDFARTSVATRINENGLIEEVATGVPRLDYSNGSCPSLLLEPQSTNLVTYSEGYNSTVWAKQNGDISEGDLGLFYLKPSSKVIKYEVTQQGYNQFYSKTENITSGTKITQQGFLKADGVPYIHLKTQGLNGSDGVVYDNINKNIVSQDSAIDLVLITSINEGWLKIVIVFTLNTNSVFNGLKVYLSESSSSIIAGVPIGTVAYQTFSQVEKLPYATSYIKTEGSTVPRAADTASKSGLENYINSEEGVLYFEGNVLSLGDSFRYISISDGTFANRVSISYTSTDNTIRVRCRVNNVNQSGVGQVTLISSVSLNKIAYKYKENNFVIFINGVKVYEHNSGVTFPENTLNKISFDRADGLENFTGSVKDLRVYKKALSDEKLITLTTL